MGLCPFQEAGMNMGGVAAPLRARLGRVPAREEGGGVFPDSGSGARVRAVDSTRASSLPAQALWKSPL